jgi:single-stranded DNA-specific DHH superfamily exonuclease
VSRDDEAPDCLADDSWNSISAEPWWPRAVASFDNMLRASDGHRGTLLLYGADADGFSASYFLHRVLWERFGAQHVEARAVWNFDYDFEWLPQLVSDTEPGLIICLDIPIIRETAVVERIADQAQLAIYDHHVVSAGTPTTLSRVLFVNSRDLGGKRCNYPTSAFGAGFAADVLDDLPSADLAILAVGLIGDKVDDQNRQLLGQLYSCFPALAPGVTDGVSLFRFTHRLNCLFRARVHETPAGAEDALAAMLASGDPARALTEFDARYRLSEAAREVQHEIGQSMEELIAKPHGDLLCAVLPIDTFSVGAIAGELAERRIADVVALGFPVDGRVAFELRTSRGGPDLTSVLSIQEKWLVPLSAGGHPMAAGALISADAVDEFKRTLADALAAYRESRKRASS